MLLVILDHFLALGLRQVIRIADRVYSATESPMKGSIPFLDRHNLVLR
jgi:hypothetical protein